MAKMAGLLIMHQERLHASRGRLQSVPAVGLQLMNSMVLVSEGRDLADGCRRAFKEEEQKFRGTRIVEFCSSLRIPDIIHIGCETLGNQSKAIQFKLAEHCLD